ncbi:MAG: hypothetical protein BJ554DRAFT_6604 [Olpidium bornovanus]|uniref:Uncharacterized protein n=1 Tax=Olpidium bornovanus TaxID=278681 RepID=A0A8H7ZXF9_9FUNG|nr:MAG: hypothetical protein BJ554DRAFT_6604 [Olpidium bornovanus]
MKDRCRGGGETAVARRAKRRWRLRGGAEMAVARSSGARRRGDGGCAAAQRCAAAQEAAGARRRVAARRRRGWRDGGLRERWLLRSSGAERVFSFALVGSGGGGALVGSGGGGALVGSAEEGSSGAGSVYGQGALGLITFCLCLGIPPGGVFIRARNSTIYICTA